MKARAVVFAYHNVGVRCLKVLLARGVDVALLVTHEDNPREEIWFDSVARTAADHDIPTISPEDPNRQDVVAREYEPWDRPRILIDTANRSVAAALAELRARLA